MEQIARENLTFINRDHDEENYLHRGSGQYRKDDIMQAVECDVLSDASSSRCAKGKRKESAARAIGDIG